MPQRPGLTSIEDRTFSFSLALIREYRSSPRKDDADRVIWRQLLKSGTSAGANSAEGPGTQSRREWLTRRHIALKEMRETEFWLRLLRESSPGAASSSLANLLDESGALVAILTAAVRTARKNDSAGNLGKQRP
jgi:four helix bundle protein